MVNYYIVLLVVLVILCVGWFFSISNKVPEGRFETVVKTLYRQCARWAIASAQDNAEIIRVLHANYATGYLWALKDIVSSAEFFRITGQDFEEFESKVVKIQDTATRMLVDKCKGLVFIDDPELFKAVYSKE